MLTPLTPYKVLTIFCGDTETATSTCVFSNLVFCCHDLTRDSSSFPSLAPFEPQTFSPGLLNFGSAA